MEGESRSTANFREYITFARIARRLAGRSGGAQRTSSQVAEGVISILVLEHCRLAFAAGRRLGIRDNHSSNANVASTCQIWAHRPSVTNANVATTSRSCSPTI